MLTPRSGREHYWNVVRAIAALLAVLSTSTIAAPLTCVGWEASAAGRRECCKRADHAGCRDQQAADNCCAAHEQSRHLTPALSATPQATPPTVASLPVPSLNPTAVNRTAASRLDVVLAHRLHRPPDPLISPLRI
jgi:hypothetical protein